MNRQSEKDRAQVELLLQKAVGSSGVVSLQRMGGMTNRTYCVQMSDGEVYVVRLPGEHTQEMIDRSSECVYARLVSSLSISAQVLYIDDSGAKITRYIPGAVTMTPQTMRLPEQIRDAAAILHKLHNCAVSTENAFEPLRIAERYEQIARRCGVPMFDGFADVKRKVIRLYEAMHRACSVRCVPCHNDPIFANWIRSDTGRLLLIDWEYAGMNDPMWDLADLSVESDFSKQDDDALLRAYLHESPDRDVEMDFQANKIYVDYVWALWAKARLPFDSEGMEAYGAQRYARARHNLDVFAERCFDPDNSGGTA